MNLLLLMEHNNFFQDLHRILQELRQHSQAARETLQKQENARVAGGAADASTHFFTFKLSHSCQLLSLSLPLKRLPHKRKIEEAEKDER